MEDIVTACGTDILSAAINGTKDALKQPTLWQKISLHFDIAKYRLTQQKVLETTGKITIDQQD
jgi:hypothetical protein